MKILALEPYWGGSHRAFFDGWMTRSAHTWTLLTLPPAKWKWRMRHAAITFAQQVAERVTAGETWDLLICSDMLNLAEFLGLAPGPIRTLPALAYFHENQLTYPFLNEQERDYHFMFSNMTTALAAHEVWFNSAFHRDSFLTALHAFLRRMPDHQPLASVEQIRARAQVHPPGIESFPARGPREPGPLRILWAARWEYDKNPTLFFQAMRRLARGRTAFELSVLGGRPARRGPAIFEKARERFADRIRHWGYLESRDAYRQALLEADVVVSTADHEFFGISVVEAVAAGAFPLVPRRLAYPEVLDAGEAPGKASFFYDGGAAELVARLEELAARLEQGTLWEGDPTRGIRTVARFAWDQLVPDWDATISGVK